MHRSQEFNQISHPQFRFWERCIFFISFAVRMSLTLLVLNVTVSWFPDSGVASWQRLYIPVLIWRNASLSTAWVDLILMFGWIFFEMKSSSDAGIEASIVLERSSQIVRYEGSTVKFNRKASMQMHLCTLACIMFGVIGVTALPFGGPDIWRLRKWLRTEGIDHEMTLFPE